jgi:hypothetical protein
MVKENNMDIKELLSNWNNLTDQEKIIKDTKSIIKEQIAKILHKRKLNSLICEDNNENNWEIKYQQSSRNNINIELLNEILNPEDFNKVVNITISTSLIIKKTKKTNKKNIINTPPIDIDLNNEEKLKIPKWEIS